MLAAKEQAGSWRKLALALSEMATYKSISHIGVSGWYEAYRVPAPWAILLDEYCPKCSMYALCPYLKEVGRKEAA